MCSHCSLRTIDQCLQNGPSSSYRGGAKLDLHPVINRHKFTSAGPRASNQDYVVIEDLPAIGLFASVADGVGGNNCGEIASKAGSDTVISALKEGVTDLTECIKRAHGEVKELAGTNLATKGMATTLTCVIINEMQLSGAHVGDSRIYILRRNGIRQLTNDQTELAKLIRSGTITSEQAYSHPYRNVLYSAVGGTKELIIQTFAFDLLPKDRVLLLTDGAYAAISKIGIRDCSVSHADFDEFCRSLIAFIEDAKPNDNFSVLALQIGNNQLANLESVPGGVSDRA